MIISMPIALLSYPSFTDFFSKAHPSADSQLSALVELQSDLELAAVPQQ
jgi:hypothetical protein